MEELVERMRLMDALDRYEMELQGLVEMEPRNAATVPLVQGRRRDLENRIWFIKHCLDYPMVPRAEC